MVPGAVEGEALADVATASEGDALTPVPFAGEFSRGRFLWLVPDGVGDFLTVPFDVVQTGEYTVSLYLVAASDFAITQCEIDGVPVGEPIDAYNGTGGIGVTHVVPTGPRSLPPVALSAGNHELTLRVAGRHPDATGWMIGLDCMSVTRTEE